MANVLLGTKAVGSTVKLNVNGAAKEFIVVHQGKPGSMYDDSCNGTWLLMKDRAEKRKWSDSGTTYSSSSIHSYLNSTFLGLFDSNIQEVVHLAKIPSESKKSVDAKVFLLSATEVGLKSSSAVVEGEKLPYFESAGREAASGWLRTRYTTSTNHVWCISVNGTSFDYGMTASAGFHPALVLPSTLLVSDDGTVSTNTPPTITSTSGASGVNLGSKAAAFTFQYTVSDDDGNTLTVMEKLDGVTKKTRSDIASGTTLTFECASTAAEFQKILNGTHTITIEVSDGKETATFTASFSKAVYKAIITLKTPLAVSGDITLAIMSVTGQIPAGAVYKVEATNNAKDTSPVWQDVTEEVKSGANIVFTNKTAANGAAFNFRITVERGTSAGGYISGVSGAFQ